ncbi:MAG: hypothetical protein WBA71_05295 [Candidatus Humimicrobiia bacterium]
MTTKLKQMRKKVLEELKYIPDCPDPQRELRMHYWARRMNSLGKKAMSEKKAKEVLKECIAYLKKGYPDFEFKYNEKFFNRR